MKKNRVLCVAGLLVGFAGALMLIPQVRTSAGTLAGRLGRRAGQAWEEGKKAKRRREHQLEEEVLGLSEPGEAAEDAPDYIV